MSGWIWLGLILLLIATFLSIRLRLSIVYDAEGACIAVRFGRITVFRYPGMKGKEKQKEEQSEPEQPEPEEEQEEQKKGGKLPALRDLLSIIGNTLGKLKRKLRIDELILWYCSAAEDPFSAAMAFGGVSAAAGLITAPLDRTFRIKRRDIRTAVSFTETEPTVILKLNLSLSLFSLLSLALYAGVRYLLAMRRKNRKQPSDDGQCLDNTEE